MKLGPGSFNCTLVGYYQLQFVIVHRVWHWQLTRHALKKTWNWLFDCTMSKLVQIQMINRICKKYSRTHTHAPWPNGSYWAGRLITTHVSFEVTSSTLIVTNWAAERSFTSVNIFVNTHRWTTFQLLILWLSMSTGRWTQTTHAQLLRFTTLQSLYVTTLSRRYCRVVRRPLQSLNW